MSSDYVSVILPTYNRAYCLADAIHSVLAQSYERFELIIVDDGSTDNTEDLVSQIKDDRIRYLKKMNGGAAEARNYGIENSRYEFIAFEDSDDIWHRDKLKLQMELMKENPDITLCYHRYRYQGEPDEVMFPPRDISVDYLTRNIFYNLLYENMIGCPTVVVKKDAVFEAGMFCTELKALEDYELMLRLCKNGAKVGFVSDVLLTVSESHDSISVSGINYLISSCQILGMYATDYQKSGHFDHRVTVIYNLAKKAGIEKEIMGFLENSIKRYSGGI